MLTEVAHHLQVTFGGCWVEETHAKENIFQMVVDGIATIRLGMISHKSGQQYSLSTYCVLTLPPVHPVLYHTAHSGCPVGTCSLVAETGTPETVRWQGNTKKACSNS